MKKALFCLQNEIIEEILAERGLIDKDSYILRSKEEVSLSVIDKINPDLIFFPHWSFRVPEEVIQKYSCICFHSTPLPYGRGGSPIQNMIKRGHNTTEVCSLLMEEQFDAGPVFLRTKVSLDGDLHQILIRIYEAIASQIKVFKEKEPEPLNQEGAVVHFKRFQETDNEIDFNVSIEKIYDQIRMLDSDLYPSPYLEAGECIIEFADAVYEKGQLTSTVNIKKRNSIK